MIHFQFGPLEKLLEHMRLQDISIIDIFLFS